MESPVTHLCLTGSRPRGLGHVHSVNPWGALVDICLSSYGLGPENTSEVNGSEQSDDSDCPSQLEQVLYHRSIRSVDRSPQEASSDSPSSPATAITGVPPLLGSSSSSHWALVRTALQDKQFKHSIVESISRARRPSTLKAYEGKWRVFRDWCHSHHIVPLSASIPQLANFFLWLSRINSWL